jgi:hypothetical protein
VLKKWGQKKEKKASLGTGNIGEYWGRSSIYKLSIFQNSISALLFVSGHVQPPYHTEFLKVFNGGYFVEEARWQVVGQAAPQATA